MNKGKKPAGATAPAMLAIRKKQISKGLGNLPICGAETIEKKLPLVATSVQVVAQYRFVVRIGDKTNIG